MKSLYFFAAVFSVGLQVHAAEVPPAKSGFYLEPGITYQWYNSAIDYPAPLSNSTGDVQGFGLLLRPGFHINDTVFVAIDGRYSFPRFKDSTNGLDASSTEWDVSPVIGVQVPDIGIRAWFDWVVASELDPSSSNGFNYKFSNGRGVRFGVGYHIYMFSVNLEYQNIQYGKTTVEQLGPIMSGRETDMIKFRGDGWILSATFPIEF